MYHRRFVTASGFIIMFIIIEIICAAIAWKFFGQNLWNKIHAVFEQMELEEQLRREEQEQENPEGESVTTGENHDEEEDDNVYHNEQNPLGSSTGVDPAIHRLQQQRH